MGMFTYLRTFRDEAGPGAARGFDPKSFLDSVRLLGPDVSSLAIEERKFWSAGCRSTESKIVMDWVGGQRDLNG